MTSEVSFTVFGVWLNEQKKKITQFMLCCESCGDGKKDWKTVVRVSDQQLVM